MAEKITASIVTAITSLSLSTKLIILAGMVFMGANSYAITMYRQAKKDKQAFGKLDYFHSFVGGMFSGFIFFLVCLVFIDDEIVAWVGAGVGAYMGFSGVTRLGDLLVSAVEERLKKR